MALALQTTNDGSLITITGLLNGPAKSEQLVDITGTTGTIDIIINSITYTLTFATTIALSISAWVTANAAAILADTGGIVSQPTSASISLIDITATFEQISIGADTGDMAASLYAITPVTPIVNDGSVWASIDEGNGEIISDVTFKVWKGCTHCSSCTDDAYLNTFTVSALTVTDNYTSNSSGEILLNSTTFLQTIGTALADLSYDVYHVDIIINGIDDDAVEFVQQYNVCTFAKDTISCTVIKAIVDNEVNSNDLVSVFTALENANACANCCKTCELFEYLNTLIDNLDNCTTC
jgi:hypothetical protein